MKFQINQFSEEQATSLLAYHKSDYPLYATVNINANNANILLQFGDVICNKVDLKVLCLPEEDIFETVRKALKSVNPIKVNQTPEETKHSEEYAKEVESISDKDLLSVFGVHFSNNLSAHIKFELDKINSSAGFLAEFIYNSGVEHKQYVKQVVLSVMLLNDKTDCRFFNGTSNATLNLDFAGNVPAPLSLNLAKEISKEAERFAVIGGSDYKHCISDVAEALITALKESQPNEFIITEGKTCKVALLVNV